MPKKKKPLKTYDEIVLDVLREIEPATLKQLSKALDYKNSKNIWLLMKRLCGKELVYVDITHKPYIYRVKERVVSYD